MDNNILEINWKVRFIKWNEILSVYDENSKFVGWNIEWVLPDAKAAVVWTKKLIVDWSWNIADIPTEIKENKLLSPAVSSEIAVPTIKSVASCWSTKEILYGSLDWKKESLTCSDDIIICDGVVWSWYAISACNVWSTKVWTWVDNYGKYFQWWNNYGFNSTWGDTSPTSAIDSWNAAPSTYSSSTFIYWNWDWSFTRNHNLWWDADPTNEAKKWPCNTWYHIPTQSEWQEIVLNWGWWVDSTKMSNDLKLPLAGRRNWKDWVFGVWGECGFYWSSSHYGTSSYSLSFCPTSRIITNNIRYREYWYSLRCIKDK